MGSTPILATDADASAHAAERLMLRKLFDSALGAVSAACVMPRILPAPQLGRLSVIAAGKAAAAMAEIALDRIVPPAAALVVTRHGHATEKLAARPWVELIEAGHPYPDAQSIRAADRALEIARGLEAQDHLLVLLSGGGSALLAAPAPGITLADKQATTQRLLDNQQHIGDAIKPFYGDAAGERLTSLLREHIVVAANLLAAAKSGDQAGVERETSAWYRNADQIADFLHGANPRHWERSEMRSMMREHLDLTLAEAVAHLQHDFGADIAAYDEIHRQILSMADMLSDGIVAQFPKRFR